MSYAELCVSSNFSFLTGASHPEELVERAAELGLAAVAITDRNSFAGIVRGHAEAKKRGIRYLVGVRVVLDDGMQLLAYPTERDAYARLCRLLTVGKRRTVKGQCQLRLDDVLEWGEGSLWVLVGEPPPAAVAASLKEAFPDCVYLGMAPGYDGEDRRRFAERRELARRAAVPTVAVGEVLMHRGSRRRLADILSCIREKTVIDRLGRLAQPNAERRLKSAAEMRRLFAEDPQAVDNTLHIAERCRFSLDELRYEYPDEPTGGLSPDRRLRQLSEEGLSRRYPNGVPQRVRAMVEKELALVASLEYARYFLTVHDVVSFARSQGILCQGRGSAANSVICFALGITEISPETIAMVFERFISEVRNEPPDIDVDFEHERREEVIQYVYRKYGRHRAGLCSTVIHFRTRAAIREVGKAMGLSEDAVAALSGLVWGWSEKGISPSLARAAGLDVQDRRLRQTLELTAEIIGFPRHLSQHVGGFVITRGRLDELCPVENAAMQERTVIEWDKDDIDVLGMLKVDVLSLGMLSCIRKAFDLLSVWKDLDCTIATLPPEDPKVYDMLSRADTVGVFQVESRAQMSFLPRMRPHNFYDLVIEVAIVRPGPIQGNMVHPYLRRRHGEESVRYPSRDLESVLGKTLGVPLFQEQAMQIAVVAAGFTPSEADGLRRALGSFRGPGKVERFRERFISGCIDNGYDRSFAEDCFRQLEGFSNYGFPESHAASFALLVYASAWLKCHHPEVFCCALLNAQPMGFYAPAQIVRDARNRGVTVLPVCAEHSYWDNVLEPEAAGGLALRLGLRQIRGFPEEDGLWLAAARGKGYGSVEAIWRRAGLPRRTLERLAAADGFATYGLNRREALWQVRGLGGDKPLELFRQSGEGLLEPASALPAMSPHEEVFEDYVALRLTLRQHPLALLNAALGPHNSSASLQKTADKSKLTVAGLVISRQRPQTAGGIIFLTLEDDSGTANIIVRPKVFDKYRREIMVGRLLRIHGRLQREGQVSHVIASRIDDLSPLLDSLGDPKPEGRGEEGREGQSQSEAQGAGGQGQQEPRGAGGVAEKPHPHADYGGEAEPRQRPLAEEVTLSLQLARLGGGARHPRQQAKKLFPSRDFH